MLLVRGERSVLGVLVRLAGFERFESGIVLVLDARMLVLVLDAGMLVLVLDEGVLVRELLGLGVFVLDEGLGPKGVRVLVLVPVRCVGPMRRVRARRTRRVCVLPRV